MQAEQNQPYSVARRAGRSSPANGQQNALHHPYIRSVATHWAKHGVPVIGWRAGGTAGDRWGGIWFDGSFRDEHGCDFHQLYWSNRVYSPSDRSGWEMHLIPAGREQQEPPPRFHLPNRFDLAPRASVPTPQQLLLDLAAFTNGSDEVPRPCRVLPSEEARYLLNERVLVPRLKRYVSKEERQTGVAQCCRTGSCDAEGPVLYRAID
jgi:hypothetical protein